MRELIQIHLMRYYKKENNYSQIRRNVTLFLSSFFLILTLAENSFSQELQVKFQDWSVFKTTKANRTICYIASSPIKKSGNYNKRGEPYFLVTDIINDADEISVSSGFIYKKKSDVELSFGSRKFYLFPHMAIAWANDKNRDIDIIKEMQKTEEFIITGTSRNGKVARDTYSLIGFVQAYDEMKKSCIKSQIKS